MSRRNNLGLQLVVLSCLLAAPSVARAGGFTIPLVGTRMAGRMAFVGYADDTSAIYHNPSGLMLTKGYRVDLSATGIYSGTTYKRYNGAYSQLGPCTRDPSRTCVTTNDTNSLADGVSPDPPFGVLPYAGFSGDFGFEKWRFGLAVLSPHNATGAFPPNGAQQYQTIKGTVFTVFVLPTVAWQPTKWLAIGAQIGPAFARIAYKRTQSLLVQDAEVDLSAFAASFAWGVGVTVGPFAGLRIGISYSSATFFGFDGTVTLRNLPAGAIKDDPNATSLTRDGTADFEFPRILRFGLNYRFSDRFDIGADMYWQNYAVYKSIKISLAQEATISVLGRDVAFKDLEEPKDSKNVIALAFGGRFSPIKSLDLRAGFIYDQSPYPDDTYSILNPDHDKAGYSVGASYRFGFGLEISMAFIHLIYFDRVITETQICQRVPNIAGAGEVCASNTQAGGEVKGKNVLLLGLQASWLF
ncbi:MAG: outer membrane protein transport protein [Myxococcales bacterium]|nr:outer membrane protein transport protein [Myxococcales bacterium]